MRRTITTLALTSAFCAALLAPAPTASACSAPRSQEHPSGYCQMPSGPDPSPAPSPTSCRLEVVTYKPVVQSWGADGKGRQGVDVFANPGATVTLRGYERPSTTPRTLGTAEANRDGYAHFPLMLRGSTRVFATSDGDVCAGWETTDTLTVQVRFGALGAYRAEPRDYQFSAFYYGPSGKIGSLYRVLPDGREVLTAQTRMGGEIGAIRRLFTGSGRFGFVLRTGDDINALGASTGVRDTVIH